MPRSLMPWSGGFPRSLEEFRREMDNLTEHFFAPDRPRELFEGFVPRTNVAETENHYEVTAELPGVKPDEITLELKGGELWITGERKQEKEEKDKTFHRVEHRYGRFQRVIPLAAAVNEEKVEAEYKDGVLRITVPKAEEAKAKRITVKS